MQLFLVKEVQYVPNNKLLREEQEIQKSFV